jgi:creatinine amidohydrolase/Fe(II)-dependent formamide hydrolase-like protein
MVSARTLRLEELTGEELDSLDCETTLFLVYLSPLEVHGPHLPFGTDVFVAREVGARAIERLVSERPDLTFVELPPYFLGSDPIPRSVEIDSRAVFLLLFGTARFLATRGFRYLLLLDNHGGPRHQIATAKAVRSAYRAHRFHIIAPFLAFYRKMIELDPELTRRLNAGAGAVGDASDCHAGRNETSLMLACSPHRVRPVFSTLARTTIDTNTLVYRVASVAARLASALGARELGKDLLYAATTLSWVLSPDPPTYIGEPRLASPEAGNAMLDLFAEEAVAHTVRALEGQPPYHTPIGWTLRFIERSR